MAPQIRHAALVMLLGFLVLSGGTAYWQVLRGDDLSERSGNPRVAELSARDPRGTIYSADGVALATSERDPDGRRHRVYSAPSLAHTLGYVSITYGVSGLEERYNDDLSGTRSGDAWEQIAQELTREPGRGNDLVLTIDSRIQRAAAEALGDRPGAVVALDPRSGAVLAMVSAPVFDPSTIEEEGAELLKDPAAPLLNRATQSQYAPGSVFKTVTAATALEGGEYTAQSQFRCPSGVVVQGFVIACSGVPQGVRDYDFTHAYAWSVNANFAEIGLKVGTEQLVSEARRFGWEERIPFDLPVLPSHLLNQGGSFNDVLLATTAFGQGELTATPLQMALVAAAVANNGAIQTPYLVAEVRDADGSVLRRHQAQRWRQVISPATAATLRGFMVATVKETAASAAAVPGVQVGGKTGTAENVPGSPPHSWFTGIAPAENPTIVIAVVVENAGAGSAVAAPIAGAVFKAALGR